MGRFDFITDAADQVGETVGNLTEGASTVEANALDSLGLHDLANITEFLGEDFQAAWQVTGNFATPVLDIIPTGVDYLGDSAVATSQLINDLAHGDPDALDNFNDAGEEINKQTWDDWTKGWKDAWDESVDDYDQFAKDVEKIYPSGDDGAVMGPPATRGSDSSGEGMAGLLGGALGASGLGGGGAIGSAAGAAWQGMDVEAVQAAARQLQEMAQRTTRLIGKVDGEVSDLGVSWNGVDSERYVQQWQGQYKAVLTRSAKLLEQMSQDALQQVATQKQDSGH